jgi:hypothetical protein
MGRLDLVIRKQQVLGSNPSVGSSDPSVKPSLMGPGFVILLCRLTAGASPPLDGSAD